MIRFMTMAIVQADGYQHKFPQTACGLRALPSANDIWVPSVPSSKATGVSLTMVSRGTQTSQTTNNGFSWFFHDFSSIFPYVHSLQGSGL